MPRTRSRAFAHALDAEGQSGEAAVLFGKAGRPSAASSRPLLHVVAIGGVHQFAHFLPVAFELARRQTVDVTIFVAGPEEQREAAELAANLGMAGPKIVMMATRIETLQCLVPARLRKLVLLLTWSRRLRNCDAILCAERTTTLLKQMPGRCPRIFHIPHGAGDRAAGFENRFHLFDKVIVAGPKDRDRLIAEGRVGPEDCVIGGPVKVASALSRRQTGKPLFGNKRPVILYNPHFARRLSSAEVFTRRLVEAVTRDGRFNLVIAPHVRLAEHWSSQQRLEWEALAVEDRIVVDLGSHRAIDMTYTLGADIYVGDVSSQIYEFLVRPRPCLFVDAHEAAWEDSANYAMWNFGEVVPADCDVMAAIDRAFAQHGRFRPAQLARVGAALHGIDWTVTGMPIFPIDDPVLRGADLISGWLGAE